MTLPFNSPPLQDRFQEFKEDVLRNSKGVRICKIWLSTCVQCPTVIHMPRLRAIKVCLFYLPQDEGLDESLFQKPAKLHLTVGTMVLMSKKEVVSGSSNLQLYQGLILQKRRESGPLC